MPMVCPSELVDDRLIGMAHREHSPAHEPPLHLKRSLPPAIVPEDRVVPSAREPSLLPHQVRGRNHASDRERLSSRPRLPRPPVRAHVPLPVNEIHLAMIDRHRSTAPVLVEARKLNEVVRKRVALDVLQATLDDEGREKNVRVDRQNPLALGNLLKVVLARIRPLLVAPPDVPGALLVGDLLHVRERLSALLADRAVLLEPPALVAGDPADPPEPRRRRRVVVAQHELHLAAVVAVMCPEALERPVSAVEVEESGRPYREQRRDGGPRVGAMGDEPAASGAVAELDLDVGLS